MATTLKQDIRQSIEQYNELIKFSYGRSLDNAFNSAKLKIDNYLVCLDPPTSTGDILESSLVDTVSISWLKLDNVDSESDQGLNKSSIDSVEEIVEDCRSNFIAWLKGFKSAYSNKYNIGQFSGIEAIKINHLVSGFVATFTVSYRVKC